MAFKDLIGRWAERRASRAASAETPDTGEATETGEAQKASKAQKVSERLASAPAGARGGAGRSVVGGDPATSGLTYLASMNRFGNIKGLGKPGVSQPTVDPTRPAAQQETDEEEKKETPEAQEGLVPEETAAALDSRISDLTEASMAGAANIFDVAKAAK